MNAAPHAQSDQTPARGRFIAGVTVLVAGFVAPLLIPLVSRSELSVGWKTTLSGLLLVGIPELMTVAAVAILGKSGFNLLIGWITNRVGAFTAKHGPRQVVSQTRYRFGLLLFLIPVLFGWLSPYVADHIPGYASNELAFAAVGDVLLISSLLVLGGEFWDKLRALFVHRATARFPKAVEAR